MAEDCKIRGRRIRRITGDAITCVYEAQGDVSVIYVLINGKPFDPKSKEERDQVLKIAKTGCAHVAFYPKQHHV